jgi:hypothetical protein
MLEIFQLAQGIPVFNEIVLAAPDTGVKLDFIRPGKPGTLVERSLTATWKRESAKNSTSKWFVSA